MANKKNKRKTSKSLSKNRKPQPVELNVEASDSTETLNNSNNKEENQQLKCLVCARKFNSSEASVPFDEVFTFQILCKLFKILKISPAVCRFLLADSLSTVKVEFCESCDKTISHCLKVSQEIDNLRNVLEESTIKIKEDIIEGYYSRPDPDHDLSQRTNSNIRKTLVQCLTTCQVTVKKLPPSSFESNDKDTTKILQNRRKRGENPITCKKCDPQILFPSAAQLRKHDQEVHSMLKKPQKLQGLLKSIKCTYCHKTYYRTDFKISPDSEILHIKCDQAGCAATFSNFSLFSYHHGSTCLEKAKLIDTELQGDTVHVAGDEEKNCDSAGIIRLYSNSTGAGTGTGTGTNQEDDEEAESEAIRSRRMRNAQGPLKCKICGQGFRIQRRLEFHEERAHGEKTVQCPECPDMFPTLNTARVHQVRCHGKPLKVGYGPDGNLESFQCAYCSLEFFRKDYLVDDRSTNPPTKVFRKSIYPISNKILTEFKAFHWHHRRNCEHRPKMSHEDSTLSPAQNPSVSVSVSDKNNAGARAGRSSTRTTVKLEFPFPYACSVCGKRYKTLSSFEAHERVHRGELDHKCPHAECSLRFATIRKLSRHYSKAHPVETGEMGAKSFKYTCFPCKIVYDVKYELTKSGQKVLPCVFEKCKIVNASTDGHYKHHGKHHQKARGFKCKHCQKVFSRDHDFFLTERGERRFKCNFDGKCKKVFEKFQALWSHHRHHHNYTPGQPQIEKFDPKRHVCKFCQRVFNRAWCCRTHEITVHTKAFKYNCEICGMGRPSLPKLKQHYASHTGERPYKCDQCPKTFKKTTDLKFHMNKHNDFRPYMCELCGKSYHNGNTLYMHKRIHQRRDELASNKGDKFGDETSSESDRDGERSSSSDGD